LAQLEAEVARLRDRVASPDRYTVLLADLVRRIDRLEAAVAHAAD
jgi:hypothetical protein